MPRPLLVVDAANVVGSVPDGWWRDRRAATARLRDALVGVAAHGLPGAHPELSGPMDVALVVEGRARGVEARPGVEVVAAAGAGDDTIVELVRTASLDRVITVVTADRGLRARVVELGALVVGPRALNYRTDRSRARRSG